MNPFDRATALTSSGGGRFSVDIDAGMYAAGGANGGLLAAMILGGMTTALDNPAKTPRSMTLHYVRPAMEGTAEIDVTIEREGRTMSQLTARLSMAGKLVTFAIAAFATDREGTPEWQDLAMPDAPRPEDVPGQDPPGPGFRQYFDVRPVWGGSPFATEGGGPSAGGQDDDGDHSTVGGWLRTREPRPLDHLSVAAFTDAWFPVVFARRASELSVPTIDLTIHFRSPVEATEGYCLGRWRSTMARGGFVEEDGEIWTEGGVLLAQCRQLAVMVTG